MHPKVHRAEIEIRSARFPPSVFKAPYLFSNRCLTVDRQRTVSMISGPLYHVFSFPLKEETQFPLIAFQFSAVLFASDRFLFGLSLLISFPCILFAKSHGISGSMFPAKKTSSRFNQSVVMNWFVPAFLRKGQIPQSSLSGNAWTTL